MLAPHAAAARAPGGGLAMSGIEALPGGEAGRERRRWVIAAAGLVAVAAAAVGVVGGVMYDGAAGSGPRTQESATSLAPVTRRSLSETTQLNGTLGYAGSYT